jgi:uncharacterized protein YcfJ
MKLTTVVILGLFTMASTQALADHRHHDKHYRNQPYGKVVHVEPVYRSYTRPVRDTSCLRRDPERVQFVSYTGMVLGAVVGGALGHRIGDAHGDPGVAAIAGGLLGASIGRTIDHNISYNQGLRVTGPCRVRHQQETVRELVEYKVSYRYNGRVYHARMDHDPGEWVKLDVDISPA